MRFLIDELFPAAVCARLAERGHDAVHVRDRGLDASPDREVSALAARENRALVTENVKDFAGETDVVVVCVLKSRLPPKGLADHLAALLDKWATANPHPFTGLQWPSG